MPREERPRREGGDRPPFRERGERSEGRPSFRPRREDGEGRPSFRPRREDGEGRPSFRPRREDGEGRPSFRPRREDGEGRQVSAQDAKMAMLRDQGRSFDRKPDRDGSRGRFPG